MHQLVSRTGCKLTLIDVMALSLENGSNFRTILRMDKFLNMDTNDINLGRERERERERQRERQREREREKGVGLKSKEAT